MSDLTAEMTDTFTENLSVGEETMDVVSEHQSGPLLVDPQPNDVVISEKPVTIEDACTNYADAVMPVTNSYMNNGEHLEITVEGNEVVISTDDISKYEGDISANEEVTTVDDDRDMTSDAIDAVYGVASIDEELAAGENVISTNDGEMYDDRLEMAVDENATANADENMVSFDEPQSIDAVTDEDSACKIVTDTDDTVQPVDNGVPTAVDDTAVVCIDENAAITDDIELCANEQVFQQHEAALEAVSDAKTTVDDVIPDEITAVDEDTVAGENLTCDTSTVEDEADNEDVTVDTNAMPEANDVEGEDIVADEEATAAEEEVTADESAIADENTTADECATADESATADEIAPTEENTTAEEITTADDDYTTASNEVTGAGEQPAASDETAKSSNSDVIKFEFVELESSGVFGEESSAAQSDSNMFVAQPETNVDQAETTNAEPAAPENDEESAIFGDVSTQNDETSAVETSAAVDDSSAGETVEQIEAELNKSFESAAESVANEPPSPQNAKPKSTASKSTTDDYKRPTHIPPHLMGRDIANPTKDLIGTGRRVQKPRLGVKVPYRNLTSQIVSQDEIAQEIFERTRRKFKYYETVEKNDILSSLKLPQRISTKLNVDEVIKKKKAKKAESAPAEQPAPVDAPTVDDGDAVAAKNVSALDSKVEELYAEISSTLAEDCPAVTETVAKSSPAVARAADSSTSAAKVVNGDATPSNPEASLDHDTLLAILEDGPDANETAESSDVSLASVGGATTPAAARKKLPTVAGRRQKRVRVALDPNVEKELALKQLMDFEANSRRGRRAKNAVRNENGVVAANSSTTTTGANATTTGADESATRDSVERKAKRTPVYSLAPKRFPKKYQRIIKRQIRSLKMKTKSSAAGGVASSSSTAQPEPAAPTPPPLQKKLPEVPEVQIAIDRYIKTYASKRKRQPDDKTTAAAAGEKPPEKKAREDNVAAATTPETRTVDESAAVTRSMDVDRAPEKSPVAAASSNAATHKSAAAAPKVVASTPKATAAAASPKIAATSTPKTAAAALTPKAPVGRPSAAAKAAAASTPKAPVGRPSAAAKGAAASTPKAPVGRPSAASKKQTAAKPAAPAAAKTKPKVNSRMMREMNRLLGDEGAINMIYSVERKRLADNRSGGDHGTDRKKDLVSKQKMVKNAVLRLSMSSSPEVVSRRRVSPETSTTDGDSSTVAAAAAAAATTPAATPTPKVRQAPETKTPPVVAAPPAKTKAAEPLPLPPAKQRRLVAAEASRIIRRHSSSSSSGDEEPVAAAPVAAVEPPPAVEANNNECAAKESSSSKKDAKVKSPKDRRESKDAAAAAAGPSSENQADAATTDNNYEISKQSYKEISLRVYDHLVHIVLASTTARMKNAVNLQMLHELINVLRELEKEDKCKAVFVTSTGATFCQGVDLQTLTRADRTERVKVADEFANTLTDFTKCLSEFRKILIAGVNGAASGLGVTMLPFFDMVFADEKATFRTPYVKLGQIPEAAATVTLPRVLGDAAAKELFFSGRTLNADEAARYGLAVRVFQSDKFDAESSSLAKKIADQSAQSMEATKMLLKRGTTSNLDEQLQLEAKLLKEQWCSDECQRRFEEYLKEAATFDN